MPLSTLRLTPRGVNRKTQGQDGVRSLLSYRALSSPTTCRFYPGAPPVRIPTYNPYVNSFQSRSQTSKVGYLFLAGIRGTDGKRQQLACLGVPGIRSCMTKKQRRPQVKDHAGGSLAAGQDPDFFFDRDGHFGPSRGIFALSSSDGMLMAAFMQGDNGTW